MKKIILLELCLIVMATAFQGDNPPAGWYIQPIPVNKNIVDIYFTDTLNGWAVTGNTGAMDSSYILKTTNGGTNWILNFGLNRNLFAIQFLDVNIGYTCGGWGTGKLYKTTNNGNNWNQILSSGIQLTDLHFINKDTGWICDYDPNFGVGLQKTTNGGNSWFQQLAPSYKPKKLFFLNKDTGWVITDDRKLYRTNNAGNNWFLNSDLSSGNTLFNLFFTSSDTGWITRQNFGIQRDSYLKTTNGGLNWQILTDPFQIANGSEPHGMYFYSSTYGYIATGAIKILKTFDGVTWGIQQNAPNGAYNSLSFTDSLHGWATHYTGNYDIASTSDGGGPVTQISNNNEQIAKDYKLYQNYPNPFNQFTIINYQCTIKCNVKLKVYDINGKEVATLVNAIKQSGNYKVRFDGGNLGSGVYFYTLYINGMKVDTKKAVLIK